MLRSSIVIAAAAILSATSASAQQLPFRPTAEGLLQCGAFDPTKRPSAEPVLTKFGDGLRCEFTPSLKAQPVQIYLVRPQFEPRATAQEPFRLEWNVHAGIPVAPAFLAGGYTSGLIGIPITLGLGSDVLVGGNENLVALQPREANAPGQPANVPNLAASVTVLELQFFGCQPDPEAC